MLFYKILVLFLSEQILQWLEGFWHLNTYEISIPALRDPKLSPSGKIGLIVSILFEYDLMVKIDASGWYEEFKAKIISL